MSRQGGLKKFKFRIGFRTIKTAVGVVLAISIAQYLGLEFYASAGIITILCIQVTIRRSIKNSITMFNACLLGLVFSFLFFEGIGFNPLILGLLLLLFIPTCVLIGIQGGFITSSVIIFHIYSYRAVTFDIILNELALIIIGIGVALLINLYMPSLDKELRRYQRRIEQNFTKILEEYAFYLRNGDHLWDGHEITGTSELLGRAHVLAFQQIENYFLRDEDKYYHYFKMREKQFEILMDMLPIISTLNQTVEQGLKLSSFLEELSAGVHQGITAAFYLDKLTDLRQEIKEMPLPLSRDEFEVRAHLFYLLNQFETYLEIERQFKVIK